MSGSVNKVILIGNLGADPEIRTFDSGNKVCNFSVATSERWKDRATGENRERTQWHRVVVFSEPIVRVAEQYLQRGQRVYLEGKLETRRWQDPSGQERFMTEVVLRPYQGQLVMLSGREDSGEGSYQQSSDFGGSASATQSSQKYGDGRSSGAYAHKASREPLPQSDDLDDDVPF